MQSASRAIHGASFTRSADARGHRQSLRAHPWGEPISGPLDGLGYTGHEMDADTGLVYAQQRYYDPIVGRFLSVDPVAAAANTGGNFNRYWYANNNPYRFTDPDGRIIESIFDAASLGLGVSSLVGNLKEGNFGAAALDAVGVIADGLALATPVVPGGAGVAIKASRGAERASNAAGATKAIPKTPTGKGTVPPSQRDPKRVVSETEKKEVLAEQGGKCAQCGKQTTTQDSAAHHVERHADGGQTTKENTAVVCTPCHKELHDGK